ncbi:MAG: histone deacetylase, partial [Halobacteriaceae archaeon]
DAHRHDPISRLHLSTEAYARLANRIKSFGDEHDVPLAFVLEGGYGLETLSEGVSAVNKVFNGYEPTTVEDAPAESTREIVESVRSNQGLGLK